jgi:hypothetical protein
VDAYAGVVGKFLLVIIVFAAVVYATLWLVERRRAGAPARRAPAPPRPAPRMVAPDDDEDFLRDLRRRNRRPDQGDKPNGD